MNEIIVRIDELRIKSGLSKAALANKIGVTPTTVSNWNKYDTMPSLQVIDSICKAVGVTAEQFFAGLGKPKDRNDEERFIENWRMLSDTQKKIVETVIDELARCKHAGDV